MTQRITPAEQKARLDQIRSDRHSIMGDVRTVRSKYGRPGVAAGAARHYSRTIKARFEVNEEEPKKAAARALVMVDGFLLHPKQGKRGAEYHMIKILDVAGMLAGTMSLILFGFIPLFDIYVATSGWADKSAMMMYSIIFWSGVLISLCLSIALQESLRRDNGLIPKNNMIVFSILFSWISCLLLTVVWSICLFEERQERRKEFEDRLMGR